MSILLAFLSLTIELAFGYPDRLFRAIGHPVTWMGRLIGSLDGTLNREEWTKQSRRAGGVAALIILIAIAGITGWAIQSLLGAGVGLAVTAVLASTLLAQRSLRIHVEAVAHALETEGLDGGRRAVSQIVGRDTAALDEAGVSRAAIESLAENFSDGVVAPAFWLAVIGLPGALAYKAVNTADSMIGHRTPRHEAFGWAAACFDDLVNLPASRLSALLILIAAHLTGEGSPAKAWRTVSRDAGRHRSPNAGWPEAAMAGALGLALAGPRNYGGVLVQDATMGEGGRHEATAADIRRALRLYRAADAVLITLLGVLAGLFMLHG
ncbi:adenosylcobinamide-phosphate synthase CbiB [Chelativorans sp. YIM 93263]|uniref:adenosylcobinamide-phosphate synthase CbiB n=1 Tax=Chelativorans sp. YIM 93263 TaxID=2906648 RepID=UPI00237803FB|nr:adenosylcobinamide-phosphate synthase CbiB [Chelativorans sp. YIM 93263]